MSCTACSSTIGAGAGVRPHPPFCCPLKAALYCGACSEYGHGPKHCPMLNYDEPSVAPAAYPDLGWTSEDFGAGPLQEGHEPEEVPLSKAAIRGQLSLYGNAWKVLQSDEDEDQRLLTNVLYLESLAPHPIQWVKDYSEPDALGKIQAMRAAVAAAAPAATKKGGRKAGDGEQKKRTRQKKPGAAAKDNA